MAEKIIKEVFWTESAKNSFSKMISYLEATWTEKEIKRFIDRTNEIIDLIEYFPELYAGSSKKKNVHLALINKYVQLVYHYKPRKKQIEILIFWDTRQNRDRLKW